MRAELVETVLEGPGSGVPRSDGLHLTPIIRDMALKLGVIKDRGGDDSGPPPCLIEMGFTFEDLLAHVFANRMAERPGEVELDGITGSPDGITVYNNNLTVEEFKCTWKSSRQGVLDQWMWLTQIKAYCKMLGTTQAILRVMWINGNYAPPSPSYQAYLLLFTQAEIDENWEMVKNHARAMGALK